MLRDAKNINKGQRGKEKEMINKLKNGLFAVVLVFVISTCITVSVLAYTTVVSDSVTNSTDAPVLYSYSDEVITTKGTSGEFNCYKQDKAITARYAPAITINRSSSAIQRSYMVAIPQTCGSGRVVGVNTSPEILLKSRRFVPEPGLYFGFESNLSPMTDAGGERTHVLIRFHNIPNTSGRVELNEKFNAEILPDNKISPHIRDYGVGAWAVNPDGNASLLVTFFDDVSKDEAKQVIEKHGSVITEPSPWGGNVWTVSVPEDIITSLASEDAVEWIESVPPPKTITNVADTLE